MHSFMLGLGQTRLYVSEQANTGACSSCMQFRPKPSRGYDKQEDSFELQNDVRQRSMSSDGVEQEAAFFWRRSAFDIGLNAMFVYHWLLDAAAHMRANHEHQG